MRRVVILGAASAIARETARILAADGDRIMLVARDAERLATIAADLRVRGAGHVGTRVADLDRLETHEELLEQSTVELEGLDTVILAYGVLGDADLSREEPAEVTRILHTNLTGPASLLTLAARRLERQGSGTIVGISSVAGDRGRQSNYAYGASKGGLSLLLQGLRNRLHASGVRVVTIKPGFVATPMTEHLDRNFLFCSPGTVARAIHRSLRGGGEVVYVPWFWWPVMTLIRAIPERIFKRLKL